MMLFKQGRFNIGRCLFGLLSCFLLVSCSLAEEPLQSSNIEPVPEPSEPGQSYILENADEADFWSIYKGEAVSADESANRETSMEKYRGAGPFSISTAGPYSQEDYENTLELYAFLIEEGSNFDLDSSALLPTAEGTSGEEVFLRYFYYRRSPFYQSEIKVQQAELIHINNETDAYADYKLTINVLESANPLLRSGVQAWWIRIGESIDGNDGLVMREFASWEKYSGAVSVAEKHPEVEQQVRNYFEVGDTFFSDVSQLPVDTLLRYVVWSGQDVHTEQWDIPVKSNDLETFARQYLGADIDFSASSYYAEGDFIIPGDERYKSFGRTYYIWSVEEDDGEIYVLVDCFAGSTYPEKTVLFTFAAGEDTIPVIKSLEDKTEDIGASFYADKQVAGQEVQPSDVSEIVLEHTEKLQLAVGDSYRGKSWLLSADISLPAGWGIEMQEYRCAIKRDGVVVGYLYEATIIDEYNNSLCGPLEITWGNLQSLTSAAFERGEGEMVIVSNGEGHYLYYNQDGIVYRCAAKESLPEIEAILASVSVTANG